MEKENLHNSLGLVALTEVKLQSLEPYRHLFPQAVVVDQTVKMGASVSDTVSFIPKVVKECSWQVENYVEQELRGLPLYQACEKLWNFVKYHIKYEKDQRGLEQVRSPRRLIHDAKGDCDCFTTFINTCLHVLGVKGVTNRITKYKQDYFQHIYPIVPIGNGKYIVMDCVVDKFNYEEPYSEKKDYKMDLQFLDGIDDTELNMLGIDARDLLGNEDNLLGELGKLLKKKAAAPGSPAPAPAKKPGIFKKPLLPSKPAEAKKPLLQKLIPKKPAPQPGAKKPIAQKMKNAGKKALKVVNKVNKVNPATVLLRAGILASMKLNIFKVAEKLKWGYATPDFAQSKGMDMSKYAKVKDVLTKLEKIFYAAGGKPENLKESILTGHGNKNREVQGIEGLSEITPLPALLGDIFHDELIAGMEGFKGFSGMEGLGELGEPATAASLTAASATIGSLAALLKSIGDLFPKKKDAAPAQDSSETPSESSESDPEPSVETSELTEQEIPASETTPASDPGAEEEAPAEENLPAENAESQVSTNEESETAVAETSENSESTEEGTNGILSGIGIKAFWQKHKKWLVPVGIGAVAITGLVIYAAGGKDEQPAKKPQSQQSLNGFHYRKRHKKKKKGGKHKGGEKKSMIALM
jgi:hypothetical protein